MGTGQFLNTFMPYYGPQMTFGGLSPFGFYSGKTETPEEAEKRRKKEEADRAAAEFQKRMEAIKLRMENKNKLNQQIAELEEYTKNLNITITKAKNGTESEDGTILTDETWEDYNKLPAWKKGVRAAGQLVQGTWKLATNFIGYETDEKTGESKWNWKICLRNAAIAAGCIALTAIPVAGPVISSGLLATGVVCGAIGTGKGIHKAINAKNPEELDHAFQDMGAGLTIGVTSALGLRGLGKGAAASGAVRSTGSNCVSQFVKDATINAYRATVSGMKNQQTVVAANGFWKTYGANLKNSFIPKLGKSKFENAQNETTNSINTRLNEISQELNNSSITQAEKAILQREEAILQAQKTELFNVTTKDGWKCLRTESKIHNDVKDIEAVIKDLKINGNVDINGTQVNMSNENLAALKGAAKRSKDLSKQIESLAKLRSSTMKKMAFYKKYASDVEAYTGKTRTNRFGRLYDTAKVGKSDITWKNALTWPFKTALAYMNMPFKIWGYADKNGGNGFYKIQETFIPVYEAGMLDMFLGFGKQPLTTAVSTQNEQGETVQQEVAVTKDVLTQLEQEKQKYDEALVNARKELYSLYTA